MRSLPLYPTRPKQAVEDERPMAVTSSCRRCELHKQANTVCMGAEGKPGGLLVVGEYPGEAEDRVGAPMWGATGRYIRSEVEKRWSGPVVFDNAVRCRPYNTKIEPHHAVRCRPYLTGTLVEGDFERILACGRSAVLGVLGRSVAILSARRGYAYTSNGVPVFIMPNPVVALRNKHLRRRFEADLTWALEANPEKPPADRDVKIVETREDAEVAATHMRDRGFTFDAEWMGLIWDDRFVVISVACVPYGSDQAYVWGRRSLESGDVCAPLREAMEDVGVGKSAWNMKGDVSALDCGLGIDVRGLDADPMVWRGLLESEADKNLEVAQELVGMGGGKLEMEHALQRARSAINAERKRADNYTLPGMHEDWIDLACRRPDAASDAFAYGGVNRDLLYRYNALDAVSTDRLVTKLRPLIAYRDYATRTWGGMLRPAIRTLTQIEKRGVMLNLDMLCAFDAYLVNRIEQVERDLFSYKRFNPDSDKQLREFLFEDLKLRPVKFTKKTNQPSVDAKSLEALREDHPVVKLIEDRTKYATFRSRYSVGMRQHIRPDGRVHTRYSLGEVRSLRLSSRDPNLQNQASRDPELAKMLKDCFVAAPGHVFVSLDFSQVEYRVAAMLSGDPVFRQVFIDGHDLHRRTAELIAPSVWGKRPEDVGKYERSIAKNVNFGILFGMGVKSLAAFIGVPIAVAERVHSAVMDQFSETKRWIQRQIREARKAGCVWTYWNGKRAHRRDLYLIADHDDEKRARAEHIAVNLPVQGTASLYTIASLNAVEDWLTEDRVPAQIINTVHDELMIEAVDEVAQEVAATAKGIMESWWMDGLPLKVDVEVGRSWGSLVDAEDFFGDPWKTRGVG